MSSYQKVSLGKSPQYFLDSFYSISLISSSSNFSPSNLLCFALPIQVMNDHFRIIKKNMYHSLTSTMSFNFQDLLIRKFCKKPPNYDYLTRRIDHCRPSVEADFSPDIIESASIESIIRHMYCLPFSHKTTLFEPIAVG